MTEIEKKALALIAEIKEERGMTAPDYLSARAALNRAIEQHEAFRQEVSDAVEKHWGNMPCEFDRFIIPKSDPLIEAMVECGFGDSSNAASDIREALAKRGFKIVWGEG